MANVFVAPKTREVVMCTQKGEQVKVTVPVVPCLAVREWISQSSKVNHRDR